MIKTLNFFKFGIHALSLRLLFFLMLFSPARKYDIVQCHFGPNGLIAVFLRDMGVLKGKIITSFHGADVSRYVKKHGKETYNTLFQRGDLFLPICEFMKKRLIQLGCPAEKILIQRMGVNCNKFDFKSRKITSQETVNVVTIARFVEKKGIEYGIRAIARIAGKGLRVKYDIVGDGLLRKKLERLVNELGMGNVINFFGEKSQREIIQIFDSSHIFLLPSITSKKGDQEGIPVSIMEAMAMGLPVVSTIHSGISEIIEDGVSGFLAPERDVDVLTEKLEFLMKNPHRWEEISKQARRKIETEYDVQQLKQQLVEKYKRVATE